MTHDSAETPSAAERPTGDGQLRVTMEPVTDEEAVVALIAWLIAEARDKEQRISEAA